MTFENQYSRLDRAIHQIAFHTYPLQTALADIENKLFSQKFQAAETKQPVFITALPRAGTTLLLETLTSLDQFAAHCYRDMPFVLIPLLWNTLSSHFTKTTEAKERAHGDGMLVDVDSPEAFEEIIWKVYWQKQYLEDRILPWKVALDPEFEAFFKKHMRKIIALRHEKQITECHYISKNNFNIARLDLIQKMFPDARIVILFRHPLQQVASLLRQHKNFLSMHSQDRFARNYMEAIGHFDFGENLRPIDFDGWIDKAGNNDQLSFEFWLTYWTATYGYVVNKINKQVCLLNYDNLTQQPTDTLESLADYLNVNDRNSLLNQAKNIRHRLNHPVDTGNTPQALLQLSDSVYTELQDLSLN